MSGPAEEHNDDLIDRLIEGLSADDELAQAHALLRTDPVARRNYVEHIHLVSALEMEKSGMADSIESLHDAPSPRRRAIAAASLALLAACVALVLWLAKTPTDTGPRLQAHADAPASDVTAAAPASHAALARIVATDAARFGGVGQPEHGALDAGSYSLVSGAMSLSFDNGVELAVEAPADFELVHAKRVLLQRGKARARVPQSGIGFVIATPAGEIEDLGTEFGVLVDADRTTALRVFTGAVELQRTGRQPMRIEEDSAAVLSHGNETALRDGEIDEIVYPSAAQIGYRQWRAFSQRLRNDPTAVVYYDFDRDPQRPDVVPDRSSRGPPLDGLVRGGIWISGRWPEKGALLFENDGDCVEVDVPGEFDAFTLHMWLRVSRLEFPLQAIFGPRGWAEGKHNMHIFNTGELAVGIKGAVYPAVQGRCIAGVMPVGRWFHLAIVVDRLAEASHYYVDGRCVASFSMELDRKIVFGPSILGGFALKADAAWPYDRQFRGWIDELALFERTLPPEEIRELYERGRGFD